MLNSVFQYIQKNKDDFFRAKKGSQFEDIFESVLKKNNFTHVHQGDKELEVILKNIKEDVQNKLGVSFIDIPSDAAWTKNSFVHSPYGSQDVPDFLVFTENKIIPIEIKYSKNKSTSPMWNSNFPKANAIYIFASYGLRDITFFNGNDVLTEFERKLFLDFFERVKKIENEFYKDMKEKYGDIYFKRGFGVYIRRAYEQNKKINKKAIIDYYKHPDRKQTEDNVINFLKSLE